MLREINPRRSDSNSGKVGGKDRSKVQGQLLVEAMIAMSVMIVGLLGIFYVVSQSLGFYRVAYEQYVAANLAAEGIEVVKNIIDSNVVARNAWNSNIPSSVSPVSLGLEYNTTNLTSIDPTWWDTNLLYDPLEGLYSYTPTSTSTPTSFKRVVTIISIPHGSNNEIDEIQVNSVVTWETHGGIPYNINLEDRFYNWRI